MTKLFLLITAFTLVMSCSGSCEEKAEIEPREGGACNPTPQEMSDWARSLRDGCVTQEYICAELTASKIENHLTPADKNKLTQWRKRKIKNGDDVINKFVTDNRIRHNCPAAR